MFGYSKWKENRKKKQQERKARLAAGGQPTKTDTVSDALDVLILWDLLDMFSSKDPETKPKPEDEGGGQFGGGGASGSWATNNGQNQIIEDVHYPPARTISSGQSDGIEPVRNIEVENVYSSSSYSSSISGTSDSGSSVMDAVSSVVSSITD